MPTFQLEKEGKGSCRYDARHLYVACGTIAEHQTGGFLSVL
jgi:hypothetical protein